MPEYAVMLISLEERRLAACKRGDAAAWGDLVKAHSALVYSIPRRRGLNTDDADDVFQRTFLALHAELPNLRSAQAIPKWLAVVAGRETMRIIRKRESRGEVSMEPIVDRAISSDESAEVLGIEAAQAAELRRCLSKMPGRCRDLLTRLYLEDQGYEQISSELGIPVGSIGPTRARCLSKLKSSLDPTLFE